jgi:hypothetical protein
LKKKQTERFLAKKLLYREKLYASNVPLTKQHNTHTHTHTTTTTFKL